MKQKRQRKYFLRPYQALALQYLAPPEQLTVSQWAERYRVMDSRSSARPGPWRNSVTPYLVGIMDAFNDYSVEEIIFVKPTQVGGTESLQNMLGYCIMQDPGPGMLVYPTELLAESISENRLTPMFQASPELTRRFRERASSKLELQFDSAYLSLCGANSPSSLASKPIRYLFLDEVDKYPSANKKEADPISLARERTKTFHNRKIYMCSTPTLRTGHIWKAMEGADVELHYFVPCPHCGKKIELQFKQLKIPSGESGMGNDERAEAACYVCQCCGAVITDGHKPRMLEQGEWKAVRGNRERARVAAFWMNTLYSPFVRFSKVAKEWLDAQGDPERLQNFINSWLAEPWENTRLRTTSNMVLERQTDIPELVVPGWAKLLTGGVDVQQGSLYWTIRAWGDHMTSQNIAHGQAADFGEVARVMNLEYPKEDGEKVMVGLALVDSGDQTDDVYDFCLQNMEWALPCKGSSRPMMSHYRISAINKSGSAANGMRLVLVDGGRYKDMIAGRMAIFNGEGSWMVYRGCDQDYAEQVTAEQKVLDKSGREQWVPKRAGADNHYLDCEVYAAAAADLMGVRFLGIETSDQSEGEKKKQQKQKPPEQSETPEEKWIGENENWLTGGN